MNLSSFLKYLGATLHINISIFPTFDLESLRTKTAHFPSMQVEVGQLDIDVREITTAHLWTIFMPAAERSPRPFKLQTKRIYHTPLPAFTTAKDDSRQTSGNPDCLPSELGNQDHSRL